MYFFYILYSTARDRYYVGSTSDLDGRIRRHNSNHAGFTGSGEDWLIVYSEQFDDKKLALTRERQVKAWKCRKKIVELINSSTPNQ